MKPTAYAVVVWDQMDAGPTPLTMRHDGALAALAGPSADAAPAIVVKGYGS